VDGQEVDAVAGKGEDDEVEQVECAEDAAGDGRVFDGFGFH